MSRSHTAVLYMKAGCHLCEGARRMLARLASRYPLSIREVDITSDNALLQRYQNTIPVVVVDGELTLGGRIDEADLREWLEGPPPEHP